ncbi:hypothetical protein M3Y97_00179000 [Aphelenchoides bicaudatus]|nr:hypothetical protein M3Y97_00179000 [Aphelenchoides bicaudatus]
MILTSSDDEPRTCCCIPVRKCAIIMGVFVAIFCGVKVGSDIYNLTKYSPNNTDGKVSTEFVTTVIDLICHTVFAIAAVMLVVGAICRNRCFHMFYIVCSVIYLVICLVIIILLIVALIRNDEVVHDRRNKTTADLVVGILLPLFVSYGLSVAIESRNSC